VSLEHLESFKVCSHIQVSSGVIVMLSDSLRTCLCDEVLDTGTFFLLLLFLKVSVDPNNIGVGRKKQVTGVRQAPRQR